ncbi:MAG: polyphosphate kinase 1 [Lautropia sp.]|nr:polyphosphate kinase 1 [Lautropia sp.]
MNDTTVSPLPPPIDREQGIIAFNRRVLALAESENAPLLERLRYITIVASNLDELFEIRVAELKEIASSTTPLAACARNSIASLAASTRELVDRQYRILGDTLLPALQKEGVQIFFPPDWNDGLRDWAHRIFMSEIEPLLTPIALDPAHPFPRISSKTLNFAVELDGRDAFGRRPSLAIVQAPRVLPIAFKVPPDVAGVPHGILLLSSIIKGFMAELFPGLTVRTQCSFRLTRNSDLFVDEEEMTNLRSALSDELGQRPWGHGVRLEMSIDTSPAVAERLRKEFDLNEDDCYWVNGSVNLGRYAKIIELAERPDLLFPPFTPSQPAALQKKDLFSVIAANDVLLHHPYESFHPVMDFLRSAARDPQVVSIKQTIYRTGADSVLMESLMEAARAGKEVTVVLELMARFDEETNINWAAKLEEVGVHVVYGVVGHKTHAKLALVLRREADGLRRYAHLGTGNYHPRTARLYEDFGLFTADEEICSDVHEVFRRLTGLGTAGGLKALLQAPFRLHGTLLQAIQRETEAAQAGRKARIIAKMNALLEERIIEALYEASQAGVQIDLIVRGVCALRPGLPGLSDNIRVTSVVGRFLEHSRIYYFWADGKERLWLASADWMERNFFRRVEVAFPLRDTPLKRRVIEEGLLNYLQPDTAAWQMDSEGDYHLCGELLSPEHDAQQRLLKKLVSPGN